MKKKIVIANIQDGRTIANLATKYGVSSASINNWIRDYRKECQATPEAMSELELMEENYKLKQILAEAEKENDFLKSSGNFRKRNRQVIYKFIDEHKNRFGLRSLLRRCDVYANGYYNYLKNTKREYHQNKQSVQKRLRISSILKVVL